MSLNEQLKSKCWKIAHEEIGNDVYENAIANRAQDILIELVVKECIQQIKNSFHADPYTGETYDNIVNDVLTGQINNLKQHFGIE